MPSQSQMFMSIEEKSGTQIAGGAINNPYEGWFEIESVMFDASLSVDVTLAANNSVLSRPHMGSVSVFVPTSTKKNYLQMLSEMQTAVKEVVIHQRIQNGNPDNDESGSEILAELHLGWAKISSVSGSAGFSLTFEPTEFVYTRQKLHPETGLSEGAAGLAGYNTKTQNFIAELDTDGTAPTAPSVS